MSNSFSNQTIAQIELFTKNDEYAKQVYVLPKHLDEKVARLHLGALGAQLTELRPEQAAYIGVPGRGPLQVRPLPLLVPSRTAAVRGGPGPHRVGRRADARPALDPRAARRRAAARRPARRRLPARDRGDRLPRARARRGRRGGRAVRGQPARPRRTTSPPRSPPTARGPRRAAARTPTPTRPTSPRSSTAPPAGHARRRRRPAHRPPRRAPRAARRRSSAARRRRPPGSLRLRALEAEGRLACPVIAVNEARTERLFNDHYGTGQSTLDGILRATNLLLAGQDDRRARLRLDRQGRRAARARRGRPGDRLRGRPDARARGAHGGLRGHAGARRRPSAATSSSPSPATATCSARAHFARMKDGAVLANAGHFDVEIDLAALRAAAVERAARGAARSSPSTTSAGGG